MKKAILFFAAMFVMTLANAQSASGSIGESFTVGDYTYTITSTDDDEVELSGSSVTALDVPSTALDSFDATTYTVTGVGLQAFENSSITSAVLPTTVVTLTKKAFAGCGSLTSITGVSNVTYIGDYCFNNCKSLEELELPSLVTIGVGAIYNSVTGAGGISSFNIPSTVTSIGNLFLGRLQNLSAVQVNWADPSVATIGANNFFRDLDIGTEGTVTLYVPTSTKSTYEAATHWGVDGTGTNPRSFHHNNIVEGTIPSQVVGDTFDVGDYSYKIASLDPYEVKLTGFSGSDLSSVSVTSPVTNPNDSNDYSIIAVEESAFEDKTGITSVTLPTSVVTVEKKAFGGCTGIASISGVSNVTTLGDYCFNNCKALSSLELPALVTIGTGSIYNSVVGAGGISNFNVPSTVTSIGKLFLGNLQNLVGVQVNWTDPSVCDIDGEHFFRNIDIDTYGTVILHVPSGYKTTYETSELWGVAEDPLSSNPNGPFHHDNIVEGGTLGTSNVDKQLDVTISPNPAKDNISISGVDLSSATVSIYDLNGSVLLETNLSGASSVDVSSLFTGVYLIKISSDSKVSIQKIIKE